MHKDCILLCYSLSASDTNLIDVVLRFLQKEHFCKIVFAITTEQTELETWVLANRKEYGFAIDVSKTNTPTQSGEAIWHGLTYCDTDDILIIHPAYFVPFDIIQLLSNQMTNHADCTIVLQQNHTQQLSDSNQLLDTHNAMLEQEMSSMVLYRMSFLSLKYAPSFDFVKDYLQLNKTNDHAIFGFVDAPQ
jgi:hypothetical protein